MVFRPQLCIRVCERVCMCVQDVYVESVLMFECVGLLNIVNMYISLSTKCTILELNNVFVFTNKNNSMKEGTDTLSVVQKGT